MHRILSTEVVLCHQPIHDGNVTIHHNNDSRQNESPQLKQFNKDSPQLKQFNKDSPQLNNDSPQVL